LLFGLARRYGVRSARFLFDLLVVPRGCAATCAR